MFMKNVFIYLFMNNWFIAYYDDTYVSESANQEIKFALHTGKMVGKRKVHLSSNT